MATLAEALVTYLAQAPALTVYPLRAPDNVGKTYVVYQQVSAVPTNTHAGETKLVRTRVQFTLVADTYAGLVAMAGALRVKLNALKTWNVAGVTLYHAWLANETDSSEEEPGEARAMRYVRRADYMLIAAEQ